MAKCVQRLGLKSSRKPQWILKNSSKEMWAGRGAMWKPLLTKNINAHLSSAKEHLADPQDFWKNVL